MAQPPNKPLKLGMGPTQYSAISGNQAARMRTNGVYFINDNLVTINTFVPNNWGYIDIPVGKYTYRQWGFSVISPSAIAGVTVVKDGKHMVTTAKIADYVDTFIIEINGAAKYELTAAELAKINAYQNHDTTDGVLRFAFGSPMVHDEDLARDAYQFGTGNLRSVKLRVKTKTAWVQGMMPVLNTEYAPVSRPIGYWQTTTRYSHVNPGAGNFMVPELAVGLDFSTIWVAGNTIQRAKLTVDREIVFDQQTYLLNSMHAAWGKDVEALGAGFIFDTFRDGQAIGIDSVTDSAAERRRGADVRLDLDMGSAGQTVNIVVFHCGLFGQQ